MIVRKVSKVTWIEEYFTTDTLGGKRKNHVVDRYNHTPIMNVLGKFDTHNSNHLLIRLGKDIVIICANISNHSSNCDNREIFKNFIDELGRKARFPKLHTIRLLGGCFDKKSVQHILKLLRDRSLIELDLSQCSFTDEALLFLLEGLNQGCSEKTLKRLILNRSITEKNISILVQGLENNTTLNYLSLCDNQFNDHCLRELDRLLEKNEALLTLEINSYDEEIPRLTIEGELVEIKEKLKRNKNIQRWNNEPQVFLYYLFIRSMNETLCGNTLNRSGMMQLPGEIFLLIFDYLVPRLNFSNKEVQKTLYLKNLSLLQNKYLEYRPPFLDNEQKIFKEDTKNSPK